MKTLHICLIVATGLVGCGGSTGTVSCGPAGSSAEATCKDILNGTTCCYSGQCSWAIDPVDMGAAQAAICTCRGGRQQCTVTSPGDPQAPCAACATGTTCVQRFDGQCKSTGVSCVSTSLVCATDSCSADCETVLCGAPYQCQHRSPCGTEAAGSFACYGP